MALKIACIDDDTRRLDMIRHSITSLSLKNGDIIFHHAASSNAAELLMRENKYDVLILDICLPKRDGEPPSLDNGLALLRKITPTHPQQTSTALNLPHRVIGITAYNDLATIARDDFEAYLIALITTEFNTLDWLYKIQNAAKISYHLHYTPPPFSRVIVTIHGIRTIGSWQAELDTQLKEHSSVTSTYNFKYGYLDAIKLIVSKNTREQLIQSVAERLLSITEEHDELITVVSHSFGTYIAAHAIARANVKVEKLILCSSMLHSKFPIHKMKHMIGKVINNCGTYDGALCASQIFVRWAGMAGRTGFYGDESSFLQNNFFNTGHNLTNEKEHIKMIDIILDQIFETKTDRIDMRKATSLQSKLNAILEYCDYYKSNHLNCSSPPPTDSASNPPAGTS